MHIVVESDGAANAGPSVWACSCEAPEVDPPPESTSSWDCADEFGRALAELSSDDSAAA